MTTAEPTNSLSPENRIEIFDTTLRDGEQSPGIALDETEKVAIARQLANLGVDTIEAGFPINSPSEFSAVRAIAQQIEGPTIAALARIHKGDIDKAADAISDSERPRIHTFVSTSDIHIEHQLRSTREDVKGLAKAGVAHAKSYVDDVEFSPMDATRADREFTAEVLQIAVDEGATVLNIPDTVGYSTPEEYADLISYFSRAVDLRGAKISTHTHNDQGIAVANAWAGINAGARQVEVSVNGIGERAGNADAASIIMLIANRGAEKGFWTGIKTEEIGPTARLVSRLTGYQLPSNQPISGKNAFSHESGIHADGVLKNRTTYEIMDPEGVGWEGESLPLGKHNGRAGFIAHLENNVAGYDREAAPLTFRLYRGFMDKIGSVTEEQFVEIHEEAKRRISARYEVIDFDAQAKEGESAASVKLLDKSTGKDITGNTNESESTNNVDGAISAILIATANATNTSYKIEGVKHSSVGKGEGAMDKARVEIRINGKTVIGTGVSSDTLKAASLGYIDAIRRAEETEKKDPADSVGP